MQSVEDSPELTQEPQRSRKTVSIYLLLLAALVILGLGSMGYVLFAADNRPPAYRFLDRATLIKVDSGFDASGGYAGKAYAYELKGDFNEVVRRVYEELQLEGGWNIDQSDHSPSTKLGVDLKSKPPSTGYYQLFTNKDGGVEVVDQEPTQWVIGDRQTTWTPGSGTNRPGVLTVYVTRRNGTMQWWASLKQKLRNLLP